MMVRCLDRTTAHLVKIGECGGESDGARDMRRTGLETMGSLLPLRRFVSDTGDHFTAKLVRFHIGQEIRVAIENADAGRCAAFVPGKSEEIAADFLNVDGRVTSALSRIDESDNPVAACYRANLADGVNTAQSV